MHKNSYLIFITILVTFGQAFTTMTKVRFYDTDFIPGSGLTYSVIAARYKAMWIFVRHRGRTTWEIAGGHIESGEGPHETAVRELAEETGATDFTIICVATYSVEKEGNTGYGRLFFADVSQIGPINDTSEIEEILLSGELPSDLTYPDIQPYLFRRVLEYLSEG